IQFAGSLSTTVTTTFNPTWQACCPGTISGPVDDGQGRLYFGSSNGKLLKYDAWSGSFGVWNDTTLHPAPQVAPGVTTILGDPSSSASAARGTRGAVSSRGVASSDDEDEQPLDPAAATTDRRMTQRSPANPQTHGTAPDQAEVTIAPSAAPTASAPAQPAWST